MSRPVLLAVDKELALARALERDLRREFHPRGFDVACVDTGAKALELISSLEDRGRRLALVVTGLEIPDLTGINLIAKARELHREVRTIVLIRHSELNTAIEAYNAGLLDRFFVRPLAPSEEQLLPVASDLLHEWSRWAEEEASAVRVVGDSRSEHTHSLRRFLKRNEIRHRFLDVERDPEARLLLSATAGESASLPLVVLADASWLEQPSLMQLAQGLGLPTQPRHSSYDLVIIGGGPAGLAAAVYGASEGLRTLVVEREGPGGQAEESSNIENYLGFPSGLKGRDLAQRALHQSKRFNAEIVRPQEAVGLSVGESSQTVRLSGWNALSCRSVLIACGVSYRRLEAPGVEELTGRGVYYGGGVAEAQDSKGEEIFIVGGANSAGQAALQFAEHARKVTMVVRESSISEGMSQYLSDRISESPKIEVRTRTHVVATAGEGGLESVTLADETRRATESVAADALYIFIGAVPHTDWLAGVVARDQRGFVLSGPDLASGGGRPPNWPLNRDPFLLETSVPGVFVAGDVRCGSIKRVASAVGEGAMAVQFAHRYLAEQTP